MRKRRYETLLPLKYNTVAIFLRKTAKTANFVVALTSVIQRQATSWRATAGQRPPWPPLRAASGVRRRQRLANQGRQDRQR
jgi:hypothetical protein